MYIVLELQLNADGALGNFVWPYNTQAEAESKYHTVLAAAALSTLPVHAAVILTSDGKLINSQCYRHGDE